MFKFWRKRKEEVALVVVKSAKEKKEYVDDLFRQIEHA